MVVELRHMTNHIFVYPCFEGFLSDGNFLSLGDVTHKTLLALSEGKHRVLLHMLEVWWRVDQSWINFYLPHHLRKVFTKLKLPQNALVNRDQQIVRCYETPANRQLVVLVRFVFTAIGQLESRCLLKVTVCKYNLNYIVFKSLTIVTNARYKGPKPGWTGELPHKVTFKLGYTSKIKHSLCS